jgi:hypothetical protein
MSSIFQEKKLLRTLLKDELHKNERIKQRRRMNKG